MKYFDLHCDTPYECYEKRQDFWQNRLAVSGRQGAAFTAWRQVFAVWIRDDAPQPFALYQNVLRDFKEKVKARPPVLTPLFAVEGGAVLETDIDRLYQLKADGVCALTLTWNGQNRLAGGAQTDAGLTDFGRQVIHKLNELIIACDLSHLNEKSFFGAIEAAEYPIATHSCCRALCDHPRNLTDEQLRLIGEKKGLIGLCFYPVFLGGDPLDMMYRHVVHLCELGLEDRIALGSDFDGADMHESLNKLEKVPALYRALSEKGLSEKLLKKVFWQNAKNYFDKRLFVI